VTKFGLYRIAAANNRPTERVTGSYLNVFLMSAAVEFATHTFGSSLGDAMARPPHAWSHDPYAPRQGGYYPHETIRERVQLPGPSSLFTAVNHSGVANRDATTYGARPSYYTEYATPSPVGQTPPQLPAPNVDPHIQPGSLQPRRPVDVRLSPTQSSICSDRSDDLDSGRYPYKGPAQAGASYSQMPPNMRFRNRDRQPSDSSMGRAAQGYPTPQERPAYPSHPASPAMRQSSSPRTESKQMSITNLLADDNPRAESKSAQKQPMPSPVQPVRSEFRIQVRQQPVAARSCGFGERDRRVIDPPPIVQLTIDDPDVPEEEIRRKLRHPHTVVHCSIYNETGDEDNSAMPEDYRQQRRLMGTLVASPFVGQDEHGEEGCFFSFPDLSCRTPGSFRLKFACVMLEPAAMRAGSKSPIVASIMSDVFTVYNAKDFPGMTASSALTKRLKEQGCLISIKKGNDKADKHGRDDSDDDDEDGASSNNRRKRQKKN